MAPVQLLDLPPEMLKQVLAWLFPGLSVVEAARACRALSNAACETAAVQTVGALKVEAAIRRCKTIADRIRFVNRAEKAKVPAILHVGEEPDPDGPRPLQLREHLQDPSYALASIFNFLPVHIGYTFPLEENLQLVRGEVTPRVRFRQPARSGFPPRWVNKCPSVILKAVPRYRSRLWQSRSDEDVDFAIVNVWPPVSELHCILPGKRETATELLSREYNTHGEGSARLHRKPLTVVIGA